jgi:HSP20 family protein
VPLGAGNVPQKIYLIGGKIMSLVRYSPLNSIDALNRQINRLFVDDRLLSWREANDAFFVPSAEISETEEAILLKLEIPGMDAKDLDVQVSKDKVTISGERKEEAKTEEKGYTRSEFRYGSFHRVISLPRTVQSNAVEAEYKDGILRLVLPKAEEEKNKVVKVNLG